MVPVPENLLTEPVEPDTQVHQAVLRRKHQMAVPLMDVHHQARALIPIYQVIMEDQQMVHLKVKINQFVAAHMILELDTEMEMVTDIPIVVDLRDSSQLINPEIEISRMESNQVISLIKHKAYHHNLVEALHHHLVEVNHQPMLFLALEMYLIYLLAYVWFDVKL